MLRHNIILLSVALDERNSEGSGTLRGERPKAISDYLMQIRAILGRTWRAFMPLGQLRRFGCLNPQSEWEGHRTWEHAWVDIVMETFHVNIALEVRDSALAASATVNVRNHSFCPLRSSIWFGPGRPAVVPFWDLSIEATISTLRP